MTNTDSWSPPLSQASWWGWCPERCRFNMSSRWYLLGNCREPWWLTRILTQSAYIWALTYIDNLVHESTVSAGIWPILLGLGEWCLKDTCKEAVLGVMLVVRNTSVPSISIQTSWVLMATWKVMCRSLRSSDRLSIRKGEVCCKALCMGKTKIRCESIWIKINEKYLRMHQSNFLWWRQHVGSESFCLFWFHKPAPSINF